MGSVATVTPNASGSATVEFPAAELGATKYRLTAPRLRSMTPTARPRSPCKPLRARHDHRLGHTLYLPRDSRITQNVRATPAGARIVVQRRTQDVRVERPGRPDHPG